MATRSPTRAPASASRAAVTAERARNARPKRGTAGVDERIYGDVFNAVMGHRLPPGTRLGESEFCDLYQVSRTTVRKALQRLAHDHIVELRPNRGAVVASPTPDQARQIFAARRAIEREIVPMVARNATTASLRRLRGAIDVEQQALRAGDRAGWIRLGGEFHIALAEGAGNAVLLRFITELVSRCSLIIAMYESPGSPMCEDDEHRRLVTLIEKGRIEDARTLMEHHLLQIEARLRLDEPERKVNLAEALCVS